MRANIIELNEARLFFAQVLPQVRVSASITVGCYRGPSLPDLPKVGLCADPPVKSSFAKL